MGSRMGSRMRSTWLLVPVLGGGAALAAVRSGAGDRGDSDAIPVVAAAAKPAKPEATNKTDAKQKIRLDPELATALYRVGLQPERLAATGVEAAVTDDVVLNVKSWIAEHPTSLREADDALFEATKARDALIRKVQSGLASRDEVAACQVAKADYDRVAAERAAKLKGVFDAGTRSLAKDQVDLVSRVHTNEAAWNVPLEYLVVDRTQEEWVHLRAALANEKISAKYGEDPDADDQAHLAEVRANQSVATARVNLETKLGEITAVWEAAAAADEQ